MDKKLALTILFNGADKLSGSLKKIIGLGKTGGQELGRMRREARDLDRQLGAVRREMAGASGNITGLANRERELAAAVEKVNGQLERQKRLLQIDGQVAKIHAQADRFKSAGQQNVMAGASMLAPFVLAAKGAMEFSSGMVDLQQKADLTNAEMIRMRGNILAAAQATYQMPEAMRSAVDVLAGFGMDAREAAKLAQPIGQLGTAFKVDLADGAAAAYANINNLKLAASDTGRAFDIMAAGGNAGAFEIKDMARWFPQLTAQARSLGQSGVGAVADLTAALQIARRGTGSADQAANNVANLLQKINAPGTIRAFQKNFGVDLPAAMEAAYRQGKTPMEAIAEITNKALGGDLKRIGFAFEDAQAQGALRMLIQDMADYKAMRAEIAGASGTVSQAFDQRELNDSSIAWANTKVQLSVLADVLGTTVLPTANRFLGIVSGVIGRVSEWAQANPRLAGTLINLVAGLAAARLGLGVLQFAFGSILGPMAAAWGWFQKLRAIGAFASIAATAGKAFGILRTAALFMAKGVMKAGLMMLANPIVLLIMAIAVAVGVAGYLIYKHWDTIKAAFWAGVEKLGQAWDWLKEKFNAGLEWLQALPGKMLTLGKDILAGLISGLDPFRLRNHLINIAKNGLTAFKNFFGIKSPSRVFMQMGGFMTEGLARGVERGERRPIAAIGRMTRGAAGIAGAASLAASPVAAAAAPAAAAPPAQISITIQQLPGEDSATLAKRVADELQRRMASQQRGAYRDG